MTNAGDKCICGHEAAQHTGLQRECTVGSGREGSCVCPRFAINGLAPSAPTAPAARDAVNHPQHYTSHPSGVECITVVEHMGFNVGNAIKYLWRADLKGAALEDLEKARWYCDREIARRKAQP